MKGVLSIVLLALAGPAFVVSQPVTTSGGTPEDEGAIRKLMADYAAAWNEHDATAVATLFTEDAELTNWRGTIRAHGREQVRNAHAPVFAGMYRQSKLTVTATRIRFYAPGVAVVHCDWDIANTIDYDGQSIIPLRQYVPVLIVTKSNGKWWIADYHNVLIQPLPPGAAEKIHGPVKP
jgi:uncharacterized protein (TIGR02246 family)